jgi:hypothetical protein
MAKLSGTWTEKELRKKYIAPLLKHTKNKSAAIALINELIIKTAGGEGDVIFWNDIKEIISEDISKFYGL